MVMTGHIQGPADYVGQITKNAVDFEPVDADRETRSPASRCPSRSDFRGCTTPSEETGSAPSRICLKSKQTNLHLLSTEGTIEKGT